MEAFPHQNPSSRRAWSRLCVAVATLLLFSAPSSASFRGPGKYSGVVFFDRWDGCILVSSVYLMYISEVVKDDLRSYAGQAIQIDALDVFQPANPGDGLIRKFKLLGPAPVKHLAEIAEGLVLVADGPFRNRGLPAVTLEIHNQGAKSATVDSSKIGLALLTKKQEDYYSFDPSDGPSTAIITRVSVLSPGGKLERSSNGVKQSFSFTIDPKDRLPQSFELQPGQSRSTTMIFEVPSGEYQFISGYGGGVHEERSLVSNPVSFDVNEAAVGRQSLLDNRVRIWSLLQQMMQSATFSKAAARKGGMVMSDDVGRVGIPQEHCRLLRCKEMFIDTGREFDITNTGSGIYWCSHTQTCLGPDTEVADPEHCKAGRGCYEGL